ncbi:DUF106 domain-containing protein [Candidatus Woesearchaeota archaeon]|nr:DUF106 domain-containing protein [Candidatus Woesearchaeota archaeon]
MSFQDLYNGFFTFIFGWALAINPLFGIFFIAFFITLFTTIIYKYSTNQNTMKQLRDDTKALQKQLKETIDLEKLKSINAELQAKSFETLKHNIKPMLITFIPTALVFLWLRTQFATSTEKIFFGIFGWLGTYILATFVFSFVLRKLLKVY